MQDIVHLTEISSISMDEVVSKTHYSLLTMNRTAFCPSFFRVFPDIPALLDVNVLADAI